MDAALELPTAEDPNVFTASDLCEDVCTISDTHETWYSCKHVNRDCNDFFHVGPTCPIRRAQIAKNALQSISSGDSRPPLPPKMCVDVLRGIATSALVSIATTKAEREFYEAIRK